MSLLPGSILPQAESWGRVNPDGTVTIDKNWWLFLYNVYLNSIGANGAVPDEALELLIEATGDVDAVDALAQSRQIANLAAQPPEVSPAASDFPDIARALLWAQDPFLQDPAPQAQPSEVVTVGASPFSYTAPFNGSVYVVGGTVSALAIVRQGTTIATGLTAGVFPLSRLDVLKITYSVAPTVTYLPT